MPARIQTVVVTPFMQNSRVLVDTVLKKAAIIDPGGDVELILQALEREEAELQSVILTHAHIDHAAGVSDLLEALKRKGVVVRMFAHEAEKTLRESIEAQARYFGLSPSEYRNSPEPDVYVNDGDLIEVGSLRAKVLFTPGHSPGHVSLYFESTPYEIHWHGNAQGFSTGNGPFVIAGDALFAGSIGRTDLPGGNQAQLLESIQQKLMTLPDETRVLSGHGPDTSIGIERTSNPYINY